MAVSDGDNAMGSIFAQALAEVSGRPVMEPDAPTDLYTDGSCLDPGKPWAAAGWGVHVANSDQMGDYYGALPVSSQTSSRAELSAIAAALQLAWASTHRHFRICTDSEYARKGIVQWVAKWK